jgi:2-oxoglutarate dehydrogenase E1 component
MDIKNFKTPIQNFSFLEKNFFDLVNQEKQISEKWIDLFKSEDIANSEILFNKLNLDQNLDNNNIFENFIEEIKKIFRKFAYMFANLNPISEDIENIENRKVFLLKIIDVLLPTYFNEFSKDELFNLFELNANQENNIVYQKLSDKQKKIVNIISSLSSKYLEKFSLESEYIYDEKKYNWINKEFEENKLFELGISNNEKIELVKNLMETELFEKFLHSRFQGSKRFSIEGGESALIFFQEFIKESAKLDVDNIILGMAHRGRLNFLTKLCGENYSSIIGLFAGNSYIDEEIGNSGDVKYHLGSSRTCSFEDNKKISVTLIPNPSHLEAVNPVALGKTRAFQDLYNDKILGKKKVIPFLIHGDASFVGQGIVYECLAMSNLDGYDTGGVIHLIIDNQVGFTANSNETRAFKYSSDVALKNLNAPIFHLNSDDPESAIILARICANFRHLFLSDIIINLVCYRRFGHNEGDDPTFTQPKMYEKITNHKTIYELYKASLIEKNIISNEKLNEFENEFNKFLSNELNLFRSKNKDDIIHSNWNNHNFIFNDSNLKISQKTCLYKDFVSNNLLNLLKEARNYNNLHEKLKRIILEARIKSIEAAVLSETEKIIDWGLAEMLAFCSILNEGKSIRLSGEDVVRGTFAHRHAAFINTETEEKFFYYNKIAKNQAKFSVVNSLLSEYGVMGFEYGYSTFDPENLVIWEAQFGDFANCAQVIIDQYISSSEQKWLKTSNLVLMLPHGYEGQGPEHSSARIERFLQLAAEFNMRIVQPTTPANLFHILKAQVHSETLKKPLIIFTPKSLLRHKLVKSSLSEFLHNASFQSIIFDKNMIDEKIDQIEKIIFCSGKIYHDIYERIIKLEESDLNFKNNILLVRIESLYPFPIQEISDLLLKFNNLLKIKLIWAQDEPKNMGAYSFVLKNLGEYFASSNEEKFKNLNMFSNFQYIGRKASAVTANGSQYAHQKEQEAIINTCFE